MSRKAGWKKRPLEQLVAERRAERALGKGRELDRLVADSIIRQVLKALERPPRINQYR